MLEIKELLAKLNEEQRQAVIHDTGPLLIVAGAGTGKTTVLINRLAYLIMEKKVEAESILLLTFTDKTAGEMTARADLIMPYGYNDLWINTFHSFCKRVLKDRGLEIGLNSDFRLVTKAEQWALIKNNLSLLDLDYFSPLGNPDKFISELVDHFSRLKDEEISPVEYDDYVDNLRADTDRIYSDDSAINDLNLAKTAELARAYRVYSQLLLDNKMMDFGDLILYTLKLFRQRPNVLAEYRRQFRYIMVDEFQDTNWSQYELLKLLMNEEQNLVAVGDDDQAIYKFRGASIANIMQFKDDFPLAKQIVLKRNYRSAQIILDKAHTLIKHNNPNRLEERLGIDKSLVGLDKVGVVRELIFATELDELAGVAETIKALRATHKLMWSDFAILARSNSAAELFAKELSRQQIPAQFMSVKGLYQKRIVLDFLAYLKILDSGHGDLSLYRVLNLPVFDFGQAEIIKLNRYGRTKLKTLYETVSVVDTVPGLAKATVDAGRKLNSLLSAHRKLIGKSRPTQIFLQVVKDCFLHYFGDDRDNGEYLNQLYKKTLTYEKQDHELTIKSLLAIIDMEQQSGDTGNGQANYEDADVVRTMTVHNAKGLEFDQVFVVNVADKRFPTVGHAYKLPVPESLVKEKLPDGDYHLPEERRLFYVAMTRAKSGLYLTRAKDYGGVQEKKPSRFLIEADIGDSLTAEATIDNQLGRDLTAMDAPIPAKTINLTRDKYSFSQLSTFAACPWQYRFAYVLKIPLEEKPAMVFGRVMHNSLHEYYRSCLSGMQGSLFGQANKPDFSWDRLKKIYDHYWTDYGYDNREQADKYRSAGTRILKTIAEEAMSESAPKIKFLEKPFAVKIKDYQLKGSIDRVDILPDGAVEIIDYKTGQAKDRVDFETKRQLLLYQVAVESVFGLPVGKLTFHYLDNNSRVSFVAKVAELEKIKSWVAETIEQIKRCDFTAKPGLMCKYCDYCKICEYRDG